MISIGKNQKKKEEGEKCHETDIDE